MTEKPKSIQTTTTVSKSGMIPRPGFIPHSTREPRLRLGIASNRHEGAVTTTMPIITEGKDSSALGDDDSDTVNRA